LVVVTPVLGVLAVATAFKAERWPISIEVPWLVNLIRKGTCRAGTQVFYGIFFLIAVYTVETIKFVRVWSNYKGAVRALAMGTTSDQEFGDLHFVSSTRIDANLNRPSWNSTTPYLSVLTAPGFAPTPEFCSALLVHEELKSYEAFAKLLKSAELRRDRVRRELDARRERIAPLLRKNPMRSLMPALTASPYCRSRHRR
jgi:hypothetical protein